MRNVWRLAPLLPLLAALGAASAHAQATAPGGPDPMVCVYNTTLPTLAAGGSGFVQCDSNGRIIISNPGSGGGGGGGSVTQGTTPWVDNITQWAGTTLGAPSNFGTSPGAVPVPGVNAFVTNFPTTQAVSWTGQTVAATQSGAWSVSISNFPTTQAVNNTQLNGVAIATGTGASNTGTQRTVLSTDSTVALSGTLPAFATTPTFNIGTAPTLTVQGTLTGNQGTPAAIANAWPTYLSQAGAALSSTNGLPTTDTNAAQSFTAPGTGAAKAQAIQGVSGGIAVPTSVASLPLPAGAATSANQNSTAAGTSATSAQGIQGVTGGVAVPVSGTFFQATQPISGTVTANQGTAAAIASAWPVYLSQGGAAIASGNPLFTQLTAGAAKIGITTTDQTTHGTTDKVAADAYFGGSAVSSGNPLPIQIFSTGGGVFAGNVAGFVNSAGGGVAIFSRIPSSAASTNATFVATGTHRVYKILACNTTTTPARIKFYDATTNPPVPGTTAVKFTRPIPAAAAAGGLACVSYDAADIGWSFSTGLGYAITTGAADSDTTAVAAGAITDLSVEYQ